MPPWRKEVRPIVTGRCATRHGPSAPEFNDSMLLGDGAWNLSRWNARGDVPGVTKEQLDKIKAKY